MTTGYRPAVLPEGAQVIADAYKHPTDGATGTLVQLKNGALVWMDTLGTIRSIRAELTCLRCGHVWTPRIDDVAVCPGCKSPLT